MTTAPKHYMRGINWMQQNAKFFTVLVTNLGKPVVDNHIVGYVPEDTDLFDKGEPIYRTPTLQVQKNKDDDAFELVINEIFLSDKTDAEVAGVLAHEAMHIIFGHLGEAWEAEEATYESDEAARIYKAKQLIAHECICNDNVVCERFDLPDIRRKNKKTGELEGGLFFGPRVVGRGVSGYSTQEVIDLMKDDDEAVQKMKGSGNDHFVILSPEDLKDLQDKIDKAVRHGIFTGKLDPKDIKSDDLKNILKINQSSKKAGNESSVVERNFKDKGLGVNWFKYLRKLDPTSFRDGGNAGDMKTSWHDIKRKHMGLYMTGIRLPVQKPRFSANNLGTLKPHMVLALDFSGSVPREMTEVMGNLAKAVPDSIEVSCCTFSTEFVPFDPKLDGNQSVASGGTDFSAVERFVSSLHLKRYPNVVVISDGYADFGGAHPSQGNLDNKWNWLLIDRSNAIQAPNIKSETIEFLHDYLLKK